MADGMVSLEADQLVVHAPTAGHNRAQPERRSTLAPSPGQTPNRDVSSTFGRPSAARSAEAAERHSRAEAAERHSRAEARQR
jgi:hypothetical protein